MPPETLEEIRLLSNLESNRHKLLHIVLFGQPELDKHLGGVDMRQLKERITHNFALEPLRRNDIGSYLMFRIRAAGYHGPDLFTPGALQLICRASEGLTRRINILADKALLSAFSENKHQIDSKQVKAAIRDAPVQPNASRQSQVDGVDRPWHGRFTHAGPRLLCRELSANADAGVGAAPVGERCRTAARRTRLAGRSRYRVRQPPPYRQHPRQRRALSMIRCRRSPNALRKPKNG